MRSEFSIRPTTIHDAGSYVSIERDAYPPEFHEDCETFIDKLRVFPEGCKIVDLAGKSVAYLICHPWTFEAPPTLNAREFAIPLKPEVFFIHSVTVMRAHQNRGIGSALVNTAIRLGKSHKFSRFTLISVQYSISFWKRFGFKDVDSLPESITEALTHYGDSAKFMRVDLAHLDEDQALVRQ